MTNDRSASDYYIQVSENIKGIFDLTTRVDERVKIVMKKQDDMERKLDSQLSMY